MQNFVLSLASLFVALVSLLTGFILQLDRRKIRDLEYRNEKLSKRLRHTIDAVSGYHTIEEYLARKEKIDLPVYRRKVRKSAGAGHFDFIEPAELEKYKADME